MSGYDMTVS